MKKLVLIGGVITVVLVAFFIVQQVSKESDEEVFTSIAETISCDETAIQQLESIANNSVSDFNQGFAYKKLYGCYLEIPDIDQAKVVGNQAIESFTNAGDDIELESMQRAISVLELQATTAEELSEEQIRRHDELESEEESL